MWSDSHRLRPSHGIPAPKQEAERRLQGETMARDICHAWMHSPSPTMGPGDQPVVAFFSLPSFPGTLLALTIDLLSPPRFFANV